MRVRTAFRPREHPRVGGTDRRAADGRLARLTGEKAGGEPPGRRLWPSGLSGRCRYL